MNKIISIIIFVFTLLSLPAPAYGAHYAGPWIGYIVLQVEANGQAWYVYPADGRAYNLNRPTDAFKIMRRLALGAKHDFIAGTDIFPQNLSGLILLDVERSGQAWYIYPRDNKKYYLGGPAEAFNVMQRLGLGISNADLADLPVGVINEPDAALAGHKKIMINKVPFTPQAPFGDWADTRQQDGCEEAASLMAMKWARGQSLAKTEALSEITGISDWLLKKYGEYRDLSGQNMIDWILRDYFKYDKAILVSHITVNDIIGELAKGNLVITPMNGQLLHNPNYKRPGPARHMIVIRGYDPAKKEFITNDPGTRFGELYRYDAGVLYGAIRAYPTGYHETIERIEKNMIVIKK